MDRRDPVTDELVGSIERIPCELCDEAGVVPPDVIERVQWAEGIRHRRIDRMVTLWDAAYFLKMPVTRYSAIERGTVAPTEDEVARIEALWTTYPKVNRA